jgi:hypothetical protein
MLTICRANERHHERLGERDEWRTFHDKGVPFLPDGFGGLASFAEERLPPGIGAATAPPRDTEMLLYVVSGALAYDDSLGGSGVVTAGEFRRMTPGVGIRHTESNASQTDWARYFCLRLHPVQLGLAPGHEQRWFSRAERRGELCAVASPDGRHGSLRLHQDVVVYSAMLEVGQHVVHELAERRIGWLHLVDGEATVGDLVLSAGDAEGLRDERAVSVTARKRSELLLLDLPERPTRWVGTP